MNHGMTGRLSYQSETVLMFGGLGLPISHLWFISKSHCFKITLWSLNIIVEYSLSPKVPAKWRSGSGSAFWESQGQTPLNLVFDLDVPGGLTLSLAAVSRVLWGANYILLFIGILKQFYPLKSTNFGLGLELLAPWTSAETNFRIFYWKLVTENGNFYLSWLVYFQITIKRQLLVFLSYFGC